MNEQRERVIPMFVGKNKAYFLFRILAYLVLVYVNKMAKYGIEFRDDTKKFIIDLIESGEWLSNIARSLKISLLTHNQPSQPCGISNLHQIQIKVFKEFALLKHWKYGKALKCITPNTEHVVVPTAGIGFLFWFVWI